MASVPQATCAVTNAPAARPARVSPLSRRAVTRQHRQDRCLPPPLRGKLQQYNPSVTRPCSPLTPTPSTDLDAAASKKDSISLSHSSLRPSYFQTLLWLLWPAAPLQLSYIRFVVLSPNCALPVSTRPSVTRGALSSLDETIPACHDTCPTYPVLPHRHLAFAILSSQSHTSLWPFAFPFFIPFFTSSSCVQHPPFPPPPKSTPKTAYTHTRSLL